MCGEQWADTSIPEDEIGSPPRVRGTATTLITQLFKGGITPACAGNR